MLAIIWSIVGRRIQLQGKTYGPVPSRLLGIARRLNHSMINYLEANIDTKSSVSENKLEKDQKDDHHIDNSEKDSPVKDISYPPEPDVMCTNNDNAKSVRLDYSEEWYLLVLAIDKILFATFFVQMFITCIWFIIKGL